jgi:predicted nicotinamide N-methyase
VVAADIDPCAFALTRHNAPSPQPRVRQSADPVVAGRVGADVILGADIFCACKLADHVGPWLRRQAAEGVSVLLADIRRKRFPTEGLDLLDGYEVSIGTYAATVNSVSGSIRMI